MKEEIIAYGHPNVTSKHKTTLEITKAENIGKIADCIIAVKANKGCRDLSKELKDGLKEGRKIKIIIEAGDIRDTVVAYGSSELELSHLEDFVIRKSDFIDDRTLAIRADKAACELKKELTEKLKEQEKIIITLVIGDISS